MNGNSSTQCRICLAHGAEILLFGSEESKQIVSKLSQCVHEQVEDRDGYPRHICTSCNDTINTVCNFVKTFRESNELLEKASKTIVKEEFVDITDNDDHFFFYDCGIEVEHATVTLEKKSKIEFDNAQQFLELLKPFQSNIKNEPNKMIKKEPKKENMKNKTNLVEKRAMRNEPNKMVKKEPKRQIRKENMQNKINLVKNRAKVKIDTERADSILERKNSENIHINEEAITVDSKFNNNTKETKKKTEPETVLCDLCGKVFNSGKQLRNHQISNHLKKALECPVCKKEIYYLNRHIRRVHSKEGRHFICSACGKTFIYKNDLAMHYRSVHEKHLVIKKRYPCKHCDRTFARDSVALAHERSVHTGERPAVCSVCDSRFYHEDYLKEHMRLHTGETPFKCPICSRGYAQRGNMKSHIRHRHSKSELDELTLKTLKPSIVRLLKP